MVVQSVLSVPEEHRRRLGLGTSVNLKTFLLYEYVKPVFCTSLSPTVSGGGDPSLNCSSQGFFHFFSLVSFSGSFSLVFLEGLGWLRGRSMGVCEARCDMLVKRATQTTLIRTSDKTVLPKAFVFSTLAWVCSPNYAGEMG